MIRRALFLCGIVAAVLYVVTVVVGGVLRPGYDHLSMAVSELIQAGASNKTLLDALFAVYNVLLLAFAWAAGMSLRGEGRGLISAGAFVLGAVGLLGLAMTLFFPMNPRGAPATTAGILHLILAGALSLGTIVSIAFFTFGSKDHGPYWIYCLATGVLVLVSGAVAAATAATASPYLGLAERTTIGLFLQWLAVFSVRLVREDLGM